MSKLVKMKLVVAYIRVSSEKQVDNFSLAFQEKMIRKYAAENNYKICKIFREEGYSATNTNRPSYKQMIAYLEENDIDAVLVHKLDRLHRDETNMFNDFRRFKESNIRLIAIADGIDTADDSSSLATAVLTAISANYSRNLSKETRKGLYTAAENGFHTGGLPPYGFKINRDTMQLEIDETTAPAVRKMFELYADGYGSSDICKWLTGNGFTTAKGNAFTPSALNEIFHNEKYCGCYTWDKSSPKDVNGKRNTHKHKENYLKIENGCPAIVTAETFQKVQQRLKENAEKASKRSPDRYYPLTGLIYCKCGSPMCGGVSYSKGRKYYKYNCNHKCGNKAVRADYVEAFVINAITQCIFSEPNKQPLMSELNKFSENHAKAMSSEYHQLRCKLSGLESSQENLMKALEKGKAANSIMNRLERIEQQKEQTVFQITHLSREAHTFTEEDMELLHSRFSNYLQTKRSINNMEFIKMIINRVEVDADNVKITLNSGISIDKTTKILMKGTDTMIKINKTSVREYEGIMLSIGNSEIEGNLAVKVGIDDSSAIFGYDTIIDLNIPEEFLYEMMANAEAEVFDIMGEPLKITCSVTDSEIVGIDNIELKNNYGGI